MQGGGAAACPLLPCRDIDPSVAAIGTLAGIFHSREYYPYREISNERQA